MTLRLPYNYAPRSYHRRIYAAWQAGIRHFCLVMHRRSGKCLTANTMIETCEGASRLGTLYAAQQEFAVWAWDGEQCVRARALPPIKKSGVHPCYRVTLADGRWFECADYHRVLTASGWQPWQHLLGSVGSRLASSAGDVQPVPGVNGEHWLQKPQDFLGDCPRDCHCDDAQLLWAQDTDEGWLPSRADVLRLDALWWQRDGRAYRDTNSVLRAPALLANTGDLALCECRECSGQCQSVHTSGRVCSDVWQGVSQPVHKGPVLVQAIDEPAQSLQREMVLASPVPFLVDATCRIISCIPIGHQEVYDFTVPFWHNYVTANLVHHNTESLVAFMPQPMLQRKGNYAHIFPLLKQAREVVWDGIGRSGMRYIEHFPAPLLYAPPNKSELKITLRDAAQLLEPGSTYQLLGTDKNVNALVGGGTVGCYWDEYPLQNPLARDYARPIMAENDGWEMLVYTPRGENHGLDMYTYAQSASGWHVEYLTVEDTKRDAPGESGGPVITQEAIEEHRRELLARGVEGADAIIEQEYYLSWHAPMPGSYYAREMQLLEREGRICSVPYDPAFPVQTAWDLGRNDMNVIWFFQMRGETVCFIDCLADSSVALLPDPKRPEERSWIGTIRALPYNYDHSLVNPPLTKDRYEVHYGPHDLAVHEYSSNKTRYGQALEHGLRFTVLPHPGPGGLADGIATTRRLLRRSVFDAEKCKRGLGGLRSYCRAFDEEKMVYADTPLHNWASNYADAYRYAAVGLMPPLQPKEAAPPPQSYASIAAEYDRSRRTGRRMRPWAVRG